jgi:uncharacterized membrane protein HdeD (DUF308 family)
MMQQPKMARVWNLVPAIIIIICGLVLLATGRSDYRTIEETGPQIRIIGLAGIIYGIFGIVSWVKKRRSGTNGAREGGDQ